MNLFNKFLIKRTFCLFDMDGLLVNTEHLHQQAYQKMCSLHGFTLNWDDKKYAANALFGGDKLRDALGKEFPSLFKTQEEWDALYEEKKAIYFELLRGQSVELMPGVEELLNFIAAEKINCCVVTHSNLQQVSIIKTHIPLLNSIPHWVTREDYSISKPSPECYLKAIELYRKPAQILVGFEDSPRGLQALVGAKVMPVAISSLFTKDELSQWVEGSFTHFSSMNDVVALIHS